MMPAKEFITKIIYDVKQAVSSMRKLESESKKGSRRIKNEFKGMAKVTDGVVDAIGKFNPVAGRMAGKFAKIAASAGPAGVAITVVGTAAIVTAANVFKLADSMRDYDAIIGKFLANAKKAQGFADDASAGIDAGLDFEFSEAKRLAAIRRAQITEKQIASENAISRAKEEISIEKSKLREIESLRNAARRKTLDAEAQLRAKLNEGSIVGGEFANRPKGRQVTDLTAKAASEARKGNIEGAEALIDRAKELSSELGNHVFFTKQIDQANNAVIQAMRKNVDESKKNEKNLDGQAAKLKKSVAASQARLKAEQAVKREFDEQLRSLSAQTAEISKQKRFEKQRQTVDQSQRNINSARTSLEKIFTELANPGTVRKGIETLQAGTRGVLSPSTLGSVKEDAATVAGLEEGISQAILKAFEGGLTRQKLVDLAGSAERASTIATTLQEDIDAGTASPAVQDRLDRMITVLTSIKEATGAVGGLGPLGLNETVQSGQARIAGEADAAAEATRTFNTNITVQIKGGAIDGEVIKKLEPEIDRAVRKSVSKLKQGS